MAKQGSEGEVGSSFFVEDEGGKIADRALEIFEKKRNVADASYKKWLREKKVEARKAKKATKSEDLDTPKKGSKLSGGAGGGKGNIVIEVYPTKGNAHQNGCLDDGPRLTSRLIPIAEIDLPHELPFISRGGGPHGNHGS